MPKMSTHVLPTSRKNSSGCHEESFW